MDDGSIARLINQTGVTYRQLDHWVRQGYVGETGAKSVGSGHIRSFSRAEVAHLEVMACLVKAGIAPGVATVWAKSLLETGVVQVGQGIRLERPLREGTLKTPMP